MRHSIFNASTSNPLPESSHNSLYQSVIIPKSRVSNSKMASTELTRPGERAGSPSKLNSEIQDLKQKIFEVSKILAEHTKEISQIKESKENLSTQGSCDTLRGSIQSDTFKEVHKEIDNVLGDFQTHLGRQIDRLKMEILSVVPTRQEVLSFTRGLQIKVDNFKSGFISKQLSEIHAKIHDQGVLIKEELYQRIKNLHQANRKVFAEIERDMKEFNIQISKQPDTPTIISSNKKFHSPIILKYREFFERIGQKQPVILNEMSYYIDTEGFLLDNTCCYLVGKDGKEIQLDQKHLDLLKVHRILN